METSFREILEKIVCCFSYNFVVGKISRVTRIAETYSDNRNFECNQFNTIISSFLFPSCYFC